jgi:arginine/serine-rich splicing factor 4/5/6
MPTLILILLLPTLPCSTSPLFLHYRAVPNVTNALRAEFARGDGRTKRKEDERRKRISPSETLFVVNFHEATTRQEDLRMLFEPYGELVRIDMKRNYAFVQFRTIEEATRAKEVTNGGKLDQSVLTVEYVARRRDRDGGGGGGGDRRRRDDRRRDDRRRSGGGGGGPPPPRDRDYGRRDDRYYDDRRSPPRERYYRGRSRSRSRSPPRHYRSRSPPRDRYYYDDDRPPRGRSPPDGAGYRGRSPDDGYRGSRGRSSDRESYGRGGDRDRGYRA